MKSIKELIKIAKSVTPRAVISGLIVGGITAFGWCWVIIMEYYGATGKRFSDFKMLSIITLVIVTSFILVVFLVYLAIVLIYKVQCKFWDSVHKEKLEGKDRMLAMLPDISMIAEFITTGNISDIESKE